MRYQFMVEVKDGRFLEFTKEPTELYPMDITMEIDSKCVGRGIAVYEQRPDESDSEFEDRVKHLVIDEYNSHRDGFNITKGLFG